MSIPEMALQFEIRTGPAAGLRMEIDPGKPFRVGRLKTAECSMPDDSYLSGEHFEIFCDGYVWWLRDLGSANGTYLAGRRIDRAELTDGAEIRAGQSTFRAVFASDAEAPSLPEIVNRMARFQPLYGVLDAARTPRILELLGASAEQYQCLYEGESVAHLATVAPYLVRLPERSRLLRRVLREGWGHAWGLFMVTEAPFEELRKHLRRFLIVNGEDGEELYFRFYDPRVFRAFLPACVTEEKTSFFGPVTDFLAESQGSGDLERFPSPAAEVAP